MDLSQLLKINGSVKVEVSLEDLVIFANYLLANAEKIIENSQVPKPDIGGIELAEEVTGYARSSIYNMIGKRQLPHFKRNGRLYFSRTDLSKYIKSGKSIVRDKISEYTKQHSK